MEEKLLKQILQEIFSLKEYINSKFDESKEYVNSKFDESKEYVDSKFDESKEYVDSKFDESKEYVDARFNKLTVEIVKEHKNMMEIAYNKDNREVGKLKEQVKKGAKELVNAVSY